MSRTLKMALVFCYIVLLVAGCGGGGGGNGSSVPDTTPPPAPSASPASGATDITIGAVISATFSEPMDASTITDSTFILSGIQPVSGTVGYNSGTNTATFTPFTDLDPMTTYTATITTGAKDLAGNALEQDFVWIFTTGAVGSVELPRTGQTTSYAAGDDGDLQRGIAWPSPRFTDNGDGTVTDALTGLIWLQNADCFGGRTWPQALSNANSLASGACGLSDDSIAGAWRLPNLNELESLLNAEEQDTGSWLIGQGFVNVQDIYYWSSTTYAYDAGKAWQVGMTIGYAKSNVKSDTRRVWPVRALTTPPAQLWETGQTTSYAAGDDGALQRGIAWPSPRFTDNGDGTVTDELTSLVWTLDANAPGPAGCANGVEMIWQAALDYIACLNTNNYLGQSDWRLPNKKELHSLTDFSQYGPALPPNNPFINVNTNYYWSSTSCVSCTGLVWEIGMKSGRIATAGPSNEQNVWPVRGGQ
jgi:hypothetical protein